MVALTLFTVVKLPGVQGMSRTESQKMRRIAAAMKDHGLDFVSSDIHVLFPVWHYGGHSIERLKYLRLTQRKGNRKIGERTRIRIVDALERHFWHGIVLTLEQLRGRQGRFLMLSQDREDCLEDSMISSKFRVVADLGEGLVIVER
jgi:hypothetical protein